jgi:hypothetical protein
MLFSLSQIKYEMFNLMYYLFLFGTIVSLLLITFVPRIYEKNRLNNLFIFITVTLGIYITILCNIVLEKSPFGISENSGDLLLFFAIPHFAPLILYYFFLCDLMSKKIQLLKIKILRKSGLLIVSAITIFFIILFSGLILTFSLINRNSYSQIIYDLEYERAVVTLNSYSFAAYLVIVIFSCFWSYFYTKSLKTKLD